MSGQYSLVICADNDSYWVSDRSAFCCDLCGSKRGRDIPSEDFYLKKKSYDLSITYDGFYIASDRFRKACIESCIEGVSFVQLAEDQRYPMDFYRMEISGRLTVDISRAQPEVGPPCKLCGQPGFIVAPLTYAVIEEVPSRGLWRSDSSLRKG